LKGSDLARHSRDVVDAAIRGSFDIFTDNCEHPAEPWVVTILEEHEVDCEIGEDEEVETTFEPPEELAPGMSEEITGIDDEVTKIEEWQASCLAHDPAVADKRLPPEIIEHPDGHKSTKQVEKLSREIERQQKLTRATDACVRYSATEDCPSRHVRLHRSTSADELNLLATQTVVPMARVRLYLYREQRQIIEVPENITKSDLRRRASQQFGGRVRTVQDEFPPKDDTIVDCIPSFVRETGHPREEEHTLIRYLVHHEKKYPIEVWPEISRNDLIAAASNIMNGPCHVHESTTFPIKTNDEILSATAQEVRLIEIKFAALRQAEEAQSPGTTALDDASNDAPSTPRAA
jgi:hypothetical protein